MVVNLPCLWGSCPNFLRPTCPYTECWLSFQTGSRPTEWTTVSYSSCFCGSLLAFSPVWCWSLSADALPYGLLPALVRMRLCNKPHHDRVSVPRALPGRRLPRKPGRTLVYISCFLRCWLYYATAGTACFTVKNKKITIQTDTKNLRSLR